MLKATALKILPIPLPILMRQLGRPLFWHDEDLWFVLKKWLPGCRICES